MKLSSLPPTSECALSSSFRTRPWPREGVGSMRVCAAGVGDSGGDERGDEVRMVGGGSCDSFSTVSGDDGCVMGGDEGGSPSWSSAQRYGIFARLRGRPGFFYARAFLLTPK